MPEDKVDHKEVDMATSQAKVESEPLTDEVKVKITGGDDKVDLGTKEGFNGLTKEELMVYAKDPYWVRLRWALFILFWVIWVAMLVASILIIIQAPKCPSPEPRQWYMKGPVYRVSVPKFKDDLKGLKAEETLNYLVDVPSAKAEDAKVKITGGSEWTVSTFLLITNKSSRWFVTTLMTNSMKKILKIPWCFSLNLRQMQLWKNWIL